MCPMPAPRPGAPTHLAPPVLSRRCSPHPLSLWICRAWVWSRQHVRYTRAPLAYFAGPILAAAMQCEAAGRAAEATGFLNAARVRGLGPFSPPSPLCLVTDTPSPPSGHPFVALSHTPCRALFSDGDRWRGLSVGPCNLQSYSARSMLLWSLFPSFCVSPCDVPTAFNPQLGQLLTKAVADAR